MGSHPDHQGRYLSEILHQDDFWLEVTHDYIQWLFPTMEFSRVTSDAPVITSRIIATFRQDEILQTHLTASFHRMLYFYGLCCTGDEIQKSDNWNERKENWFLLDTHNNLRITRILKSMMTLGMETEARYFQKTLHRLCESEYDCGVGTLARKYWIESVQ